MRKTFLKFSGYSLFFWAVFILSVRATFPWDKARDRVSELASNSLGKPVRIAEVSPWGLAGLKLEGVEIELLDAPKPKKAGEPETKDPAKPEAQASASEDAPDTGEASAKKAAAEAAKGAPPVRLALVGAQLSLLPLLVGNLAVDFRVEGFSGEVTGSFSLARASQSWKADVLAQNLQLGGVPIWRQAVGVPVTGGLNAQLQLDVGEGKLPQAKGEFSLKLSDVKIGKGSIPLPKGGMFNAFDLESPTDVGSLDMGVSIGEAKSSDPRAVLAEITRFEQQGADLTVKMSGEVIVKSRFAFSRPSLTLQIKPGEGFVKRNALSALLKAPPVRRAKEDGFIGVHLGGTFARLTPRLKKPGKSYKKSRARKAKTPRKKG